MIETAKRPPSRALLFLEGRAIPELFGFAASAPSLSAIAPRGDGQPVNFTLGQRNGSSGRFDPRLRGIQPRCR